MLLIHNETEAYIELLCGHLLRITRRLRAIPERSWEWQPNPYTPSPRALAQHTWLWLVSDRRHLEEPDASRHPRIAEPPTDQLELCALLEQETEEWRTLLRAMTPDRLGETRLAFNWRRVNVRWLVYHMCQNVIYKHGQLATLFFQLGLDGEEPYQPPVPQNDYDRLEEMQRYPAIRWVAASDSPAELPEDAREAINVVDGRGCSALHYAVWQGEAAKVRLLLENGADVNQTYGDGWTALIDAAWLGHPKVVYALLAHGADTTCRTKGNYTALSIAQKEGYSAIAEAIRKAQAGGGNEAPTVES